jgi:hypothetical protein
MASPEQQTAADLISAEKNGELGKLHYEANLMHALADPQSVQKINQEMQAQQEKTNSNLPKMTISEDGSIKIDGQLPGQNGRSGDQTIKPEEATSNNPSYEHKNTQMKDGNTTVTLNDKSQAVGYEGLDPDGHKVAVDLDRDGHWRANPVDNGMVDNPDGGTDLGTAAPRFDPTTGELKRGDICKGDNSDILLAKKHGDGPVWAREFLIIQEFIDNFDGIGKGAKLGD